ncbi:MAG: hypothetical protein AAGB05_03980 [Pseudomonadota bacterium]
MFGLRPFDGERHLIAWRLLLFGPGCALMGGGNWAGFTIWLGLLSTLGWVSIATPPATWRSAQTSFAALRRFCLRWRL